MAKCLAGEALLDDIDDFIEEWHVLSDVAATLFEHLGMTREEYSAWVEEPQTLRVIIHARQSQLCFSDIVKDKSLYSLAARSSTPEEADAIRKWLKRTGRL